MPNCLNCLKYNEGVNYCDMACHIEAAKKAGYVEIRPNGLPIKCITASGYLLEHPEGEHPDYKFPVKVDYIGPFDAEEAEELSWLKQEVTEENYKSYKSQNHALLYTDGCVALTVYECRYYMFYLKTGLLAISKFGEINEYKLSNESRAKIFEFSEKKKQ